MRRTLAKLRSVDFYKKIPRYPSVVRSVVIGRSCLACMDDAAASIVRRRARANDLSTSSRPIPVCPPDRSDLTEATLAGASISLIATGAILLLIVLVRCWSSWACAFAPPPPSQDSSLRCDAPIAVPSALRSQSSVKVLLTCPESSSHVDIETCSAGSPPCVTMRFSNGCWGHGAVIVTSHRCPPFAS